MEINKQIAGDGELTQRQCQLCRVAQKYDSCLETRNATVQRQSCGSPQSSYDETPRNQLRMRVECLPSLCHSLPLERKIKTEAGRRAELVIIKTKAKLTPQKH